MNELEIANGHEDNSVLIVNDDPDQLIERIAPRGPSQTRGGLRISIELIRILARSPRRRPWRGRRRGAGPRVP